MHKDIPALTDSKKLTAKKRDLLYDLIVQNATYEIITVSHEQIDRVGLSKAIATSLGQIQKKITAHRYIFDGNSSFGVKDIETMVKGDLHEKNISAASILAKVTRDRWMDAVAPQYPNYSFRSHKGYITQKHIQEIRKYGYSDIHRKSVQIKALQKSLFD